MHPVSHILLLALLLVPFRAIEPRQEVPLAYAAVLQPLRYASTDSGWISMEIPGMGPMGIDMHQQSLAELTIASAADTLIASFRLITLQAEMNNPMMGTQSLGDTDMPTEPVRFWIAPNGRAYRTELPALTPRLRELLGSRAFEEAFLIRLPGRSVKRGEQWTDTTHFDNQMGEMNVSTSTISRATYAGDTTVNGRVLARIDAQQETEIVLAGAPGGMSLEQRLKGTGTQQILWDPQARVLVERTRELNTTGFMTIAAMSGEIPVSQTTRSRLRLQPAN